MSFALSQNARTCGFLYCNSAIATEPKNPNHEMKRAGVTAASAVAYYKRIGQIHLGQIVKEYTPSNPAPRNGDYTVDEMCAIMRHYQGTNPEMFGRIEI